MENSPRRPRPRARFIAIGGVWLDDIQHPQWPTIQNVVGGSVTFASLGARLFAQEAPERIRLIFRAGNDFPPDIMDVFRSWAVNLTVHLENSSPSARGVVHYGGKNGSDRFYERLTLPLLTTPEQHLTFDDLVSVECFHFFTTPDVVEKQVGSIRGIRTAMAETHEHQWPLIIWEPQAKTCSTSTLRQHLEAFSHVDVFSPNHVELNNLYSETKSSDVDREQVESAALSFLTAKMEHGREENQRDHALVIRAAEHGCYVLCNVHGTLRATWLPAYHDHDSYEVIDPTGAGNAFLGAFAVGYLETGDFAQAAMYGQIGASFAIEQVGVPVVDGEPENETWNGFKVRRRLSIYRRRLQQSEIKLVELQV